MIRSYVGRLYKKGDGCEAVAFFCYGKEGKVQSEGEHY